MESTFEVDKKHIEDLKDFVKKLPNDIVEVKGEKLILKDPSKLAVFESYIDKEKVDYIAIKKDPAKITFSFETDGSLSAKDALMESITILIKKYEDFSKQLKKLK